MIKKLRRNYHTKSIASVLLTLYNAVLNMIRDYLNICIALKTEIMLINHTIHLGKHIHDLSQLLHVLNKIILICLKSQSYFSLTPTFIASVLTILNGSTGNEAGVARIRYHVTYVVKDQWAHVFVTSPPLTLLN